MESFPGDEPQPPEGYMTAAEYAAVYGFPDAQAEFLIRAAADAANRFNEELGKEIPGVVAPPPIHKYVAPSPGGEPVLYFHESRLGELMGQIREDTARYESPDDDAPSNES